MGQRAPWQLDNRGQKIVRADAPTFPLCRGDGDRRLEWVPGDNRGFAAVGELGQLVTKGNVLPNGEFV